MANAAVNVSALMANAAVNEKRNGEAKTNRLDVQSLASASAICHPSRRGGYPFRRRAAVQESLVVSRILNCLDVFTACQTRGCARLCRIMCIDKLTFTDEQICTRAGLMTLDCSLLHNPI